MVVHVRLPVTGSQVQTSVGRKALQLVLIEQYDGSQLVSVDVQDQVGTLCVVVSWFPDPVDVPDKQSSAVLPHDVGVTHSPPAAHSRDSSGASGPQSAAGQEPLPSEHDCDRVCVNPVPVRHTPWATTATTYSPPGRRAAAAGCRAA